MSDPLRAKLAAAFRLCNWPADYERLISTLADVAADVAVIHFAVDASGGALGSGSHLGGAVDPLGSAAPLSPTNPPKQ